MTSLAGGGPRLLSVVQMLIFGLPWLASAVLMGRRGPTFGLAVVLLMGWCFHRTKRPPLVAMGMGGACLGWLVLFGLTVSIFYHLAAGLRHLAWDSGKGFLPRTANATAWGAFAFAVVASVALFAGGWLLRGR